MIGRGGAFVRLAVPAALLLATGVQAGEAPRHRRLDAARLRVDAAFLGATVWDLDLPLAGEARPDEVVPEPGPAGRLRSFEILGRGRVRVPPGEFPADLRREEVLLAGGRTAWQYRWVAPGGTTLALVRGPAGGGPEFDDPSLLVLLEEGAAVAGMRVYADEIGGGLVPTDCDLGPGACLVGDGLNFAHDASPNPDPGVTIPLSSLTTQGYSTGGGFTNPPTAVWDFAPVPSLANNVVAETDVPINADETCNAARCGYTLSTNDFMSRQDNLDNAACAGGGNPGAACDPLNPVACTGGGLCDAVTTNAVFDKSFLCAGGDTPGALCDPQAPLPCPGAGAYCAPTFLLRAGTQQEGTNRENRFCYDGMPDDRGLNRGQVAQWLFPNPDAARSFMQVGDSWESTVFNCVLNLFNLNCGASIPLIPGSLRTAPLSDGTEGRFSTDVLNEGSVKLPSGHWIDVLVLQQMANFRAFSSGSSCTFALQTIRQPVVLFLAPGEGVVAQVNGPLNASSPTGWTGVNETVIRHALLPPLAIQVDGVTDDSVSISWTPGSQFGAIERVKIYWDTDSGASSDYAFNSDDQAGQAAFDPPGPDGFPLAATITGLAPGTTHYLTVTFLRSYTEPDATPFTVEYESRRFPTVIRGTIGGPGGTPVTYPVEVAAMTTSPGCTPTTEVTDLMLSHAPAGEVTFDWAGVVGDPCLDHYVLLGAGDPSAAAGFTPVASTGLATTFTGNPPSTYYLVVAEGAGSQRGPLGHFGQ
jgi:hypothetical protein